MNENPIITIPIEFGSVTLVGYFIKQYPSKHGNCFSLIDSDNTSHRVVNFNYENLKEWIKRTKQTDIKVRNIPKSDVIWEISDDRIPNEWYSERYCTTCTPLRMLPLEQRKEYIRGCTFSKYKLEDGSTGVITSCPIKAKARTLQTTWTVEPSQDLKSFFCDKLEEQMKKQVNDFLLGYKGSQFLDTEQWWIPPTMIDKEDKE